MRRTERLVEAWLAEQTSANTEAAYRRDLTRFLAWCRANGRRALDVSAGDLDDYRDDSLADGASAATVARRLSGVASFFRYAQAVGVVDQNPAVEVVRPAAPPSTTPALDDAEATSILQAASALGPKTAALVALLTLDGLRLGEALAIDIAAVTIARRTVSVEVTRRGGRTDISLSEQSARAVSACIADRTDGPLFLGEGPARQEPARLTRFGADFLIKRASSAASIDRPVSANVLRRTHEARRLVHAR